MADERFEKGAGAADARRADDPVAAGARSAVVSLPCGIEGIERILPHRPPFLWLSRIVSCEPGASIVAELDVDPALPLFEGHFPTHPVLPGVIVMEACAQAAACAVLCSPEHAGSVGFLVGIDKARFRHQVLPGDTVRIEASIVKNTARLCVAEVKALVGDTTCATATQKYVLAREEAPAL